MVTVTVSSKFQVVIPEEVRTKLKLQAGQKIVVIEKDGVEHLIPLKPINDSRGLAKGVQRDNIREEHDRL